MVWCRMAVKDKTWRQTDTVQICAGQLASCFLSFLISQTGRINHTFLFGIFWGLNQNEMLQGRPWYLLGILWVLSIIITFIHPSTHLVTHPTMHPFQPLQQFLLFESRVGRDVGEEKQVWNRRRDYITIKQGPVASQTSVMPGPLSLVLSWQATCTYLLMATQRWCYWDFSVCPIDRKFHLRQWWGKMGRWKL